MNCVNFVLLIVGVIAINVDGFPQTTKELAAATKLTEQHYYNNDARNAIPYDNPSHIDNAKEETEGYGSKIDSVYEGFQKKTADTFNSNPVVDSIKEAEKFGNNGDHLSGLTSLIVSAMSVLSNLINKVVDAPINVAQSVVKSANTVLNQVGGKIVGLQK